MHRDGWRNVVIVASGPSLRPDDCALIMAAQAAGRCRVVAINCNYLSVPTADVLYAADGKWWKEHLPDIRASGFRGELWTQDHKAATDHGLRWVHGVPGSGIHPDQDTIYHGTNSGHQGVALAYRLGMRDGLLYGYDMQRTGGRGHWHPDHQYPLGNGNPKMFVYAFDVLARHLVAKHVRVRNASRATALECFERVDIAEGLATLGTAEHAEAA